MALDDLDALAPSEQRARAMQLVDQALPCTAIEQAMIVGTSIVVGIRVDSRERADVTNLAVLGLVFGDSRVETGWLAFAPPTPNQVALLLLRISICQPTPCDFTISFRFQQGAAAPVLDPSGLALLVRAQRLSLRFDDSDTLDQTVIDAPTDSNPLTSLASSVDAR